MKVTWTTYAHNFTSAGIIANNVIIELTKLGIDVGYHVLNLHELTKDDIKSFPSEVQKAIQKGLREDSINIFFSYPDIYNQSRAKINIGYTGADSSGWYKTNYGSPSIPCNELMNFMLTPSDYSRKIMKNCGVKVPIELFPHGINTDVFMPNKREFSYPFTFLYTGELSERKGTQDLIKTFKKLYDGNKNYKLILRANDHMRYYGGNEIYDLCKDCNNIKLIWKNDGQQDLVDYMNQAHVYVYPSRADWYGMTPFESISTGLPTIAISTNGYYEFLKEQIIDLDFKEEDIGNKHPYLLGKWNSPNLDHLEKLMIDVTNQEVYENISEWTFNNARNLVQDFSWEKITKDYLLPFLININSAYTVTEREKPVENKRVTIGIPTKDRGIELSLLLQSLLFQSYQDFDVLIIDDCSSEMLHTNTTIQSLFKILNGSGHEVTILKGERRGPHIGGQKILENSKNELILRLDDDVSLRPTFIEELVKMFDDEKVGAAGPIYLNPHEPLSTQVIDSSCTQEFLEQQGRVFWDDNNQLFLTGWLNVNIHPTENPMPVEHLNSGFMYRKSAGLKIGGYCLELSPVGHREESDFSYRLFREGYKLFINPKSIALHFHPMSGGIRETNGVMLAKANWDHDEKIFLERMQKILPRNKEKDELVSVIILTHGTDHTNLKELLKGISEYTNHKSEYIIVNNDIRKESIDDLMNVRDLFPKLDIQVIGVEKELPVGEARNSGVIWTNSESKYICFIDDDARITGRYNQVTDWIDYLYNRFHEQPDVGCVSPIVTWCDYLQSYVASVACLFTSKKVLEVVGGFDPIFGNKEKQTWGYEDTDWSYRCFLRGFKILRVKGFEFPFYHKDTTFDEKTPEREQGLLKGKELILAKYDIDKIQQYNRTVYPFTSEQMDVLEPKLNLGCYHMYIDGFINVDIKTDIGADMICDIRDIDSKFSENSVNLILCSHNLEHVSESDAKMVLKKFHRILRANGIFIIEVPDCENLDEKVEKGIIDASLRETCKHGFPGEFGQKHEAEYTRNSLLNLLVETGFKNIVENPNTSLGVNFKLKSESFRYDCRK